MVIMMMVMMMRKVTTNTRCRNIIGISGTKIIAETKVQQMNGFTIRIYEQLIIWYYTFGLTSIGTEFGLLS